MADTTTAQTTTASTSAATGAPAGPPSAMSGILSFAPFIVIMILFYFLMIYPQNKERKKREELLNALQRGDKVLTRGGIYGTVADIKENVITLKVSENTKIEVERSFIETTIKG